MLSTSKSIVIEYLELMIDKAELVIHRNEAISTYHDFLISPEKMEKIDAACMLFKLSEKLLRK